VSEIKTTITAKNGEVCVYREQDVEAILNRNRAEINEAPTWRPYASGRKDVSIRKVAEIPLVVAEQWMKEGFNILSPDPDMQKKLRQKLNDPEYAYLRTYPGKVRVSDGSK
jgi:hypothetical protein